MTLVSGDKVLLDGAGEVTGVQQAKGRERVPFSVRKVDGHTRVVPGDAELLLVQGTLDARLQADPALLRSLEPGHPRLRGQPLR